ncbi:MULTISPECIES: TetR/AcrR family transcriptional regulator [Exiguobacterium]|uniref:TetR/AcrR family transcriptional regulator n=1 Tax=Exiguobacterium antarcticum TaxID=132920 RepID=A0ABT6R227_9BACL|nr:MULTISPECIES: TetR/AcrR family transcriptional regulator [Exiguobacterium]AFS69655.1 Transcriptional regulator, TetR family [Exiguobacterium antarcticum B7]MCT4780880.1 TetR/AcrR family transcriptional regulator [Exiguobacterium soli]MDI3234994.1 TetR/AcrR family transcriptional regulator [Exiguobacterium antarcticum]
MTLSDKEYLILDAAMACFSELGYKGTTIERIAKRAHVGKPTVYQLFESKLDLFETLVTRVLQDMKAEAENAYVMTASVEENKQAMIDAIVNHQHEHLFILQITQETHTLKLQEMFELRMRIEQHIVEYIKNLLETRLELEQRSPEIPVEVTAFLLFKTYVALISEWPLIGQPLDLKTISQAMLKLL